MLLSLFRAVNVVLGRVSTSVMLGKLYGQLRILLSLEAGGHRDDLLRGVLGRHNAALLGLKLIERVIIDALLYFH